MREGPATRPVGPRCCCRPLPRAWRAVHGRRGPPSPSSPSSRLRAGQGSAREGGVVKREGGREEGRLQGGMVGYREGGMVTKRDGEKERAGYKGKGRLQERACWACGLRRQAQLSAVGELVRGAVLDGRRVTDSVRWSRHHAHTHAHTRKLTHTHLPVPPAPPAPARWWRPRAHTHARAQHTRTTPRHQLL